MASPSALRVAEPSFSASSQKITKTPRGAVDNGTKPTFTASDIGKSSKSQAVAGSQNPPEGTGNAALGCGQSPSGACFDTMACHQRRCQAPPWRASHVK